MKQITNYTLYSDVAKMLNAKGDFSFWGLSGDIMVVNVNGEWHGQSYISMLCGTLRNGEKIAKGGFY